MKTLFKAMLVLVVVSPSATMLGNIVGGQVVSGDCSHTDVQGGLCDTSPSCAGQEIQKCFDTSGFTKDINCKDNSGARACTQSCGSRFFHAVSEPHCTPVPPTPAP